MKKMVLFILLILMCCFIIGCSTKENAESLLNNIVKKSKDLNSIEAVIQVNSKIQTDFPQAKDVDMILNWKLNYIDLPKKNLSSFSGNKNNKMTKSSTSKEHSNNVQAYISEDEMYRSITTNNESTNDKWEHTKIDTNQILTSNDIFLLYNDMLANVKNLTFQEGTPYINGGKKQCYIIKGKINTDNIMTFLKKFGNLIDEGVSPCDKNSFDIELYVDKETKMPVELVTDIPSDTTEKAFLGDSNNEYTVKNASAKIDIIYKSFDKINDISIPAEALKKQIGDESKPKTAHLTYNDFRAYSYKGANLDAAYPINTAFENAALNLYINKNQIIEENNYLKVTTVDNKMQFALYKNLDKPDRLVIYSISSDGTIDTSKDLFDFIYNSGYPLTGTQCNIMLEYNNNVLNKLLNQTYNGKTIKQAIASTGDELYSATTFNMSSNHPEEQLLISTKNNKRYKYYFINDIPYLFECSTKEVAYGTQKEMKSFENLNLANEFFK